MPGLRSLVPFVNDHSKAISHILSFAIKGLLSRFLVFKAFVFPLYDFVLPLFVSGLCLSFFKELTVNSGK